jgi:hypothetical protein
MTFLLNSETRSSVSCNKLLLPMSGTNCLGKLLRLSGQRRVPEPPQRMTGVIMDMDCRASLAMTEVEDVAEIIFQTVFQRF